MFRALAPLFREFDASIANVGDTAAAGQHAESSVYTRLADDEIAHALDLHCCLVLLDFKHYYDSIKLYKLLGDMLFTTEARLHTVRESLYLTMRYLSQAQE